MRQKVLLAHFGQMIKQQSPSALKNTLNLAFNKLADKGSSLCRWKPSAEYMAGNTFSRQALPIVWDFCEAQPFAGASGSWEKEVVWIAKVIEELNRLNLSPGQVQQADAEIHRSPLHHTIDPSDHAEPHRQSRYQQGATSCHRR